MKGDKPARNHPKTLSYTSTGEGLTQVQIDRRYSLSLERKWAGYFGIPPCEACGGQSDDTDHTIAQARCKKIRKTELIWDPDNMPRSCRKCHNEWEAIKGYKWVNHKNVAERLVYLEKHDPEGYASRMSLVL